MPWPEVATAKNEARREIVLSGPEIAKRIEQHGLDPTIFTVSSLNYVNISEARLTALPDDVKKLSILQTLVLHSNKLTSVPKCVSELKQLKLLDVSRNEIAEFPEEIVTIESLVTLNISGNKLTQFPKVSINTKLQVLDLTGNQLEQFPDCCYEELACLSDLKLASNSIETIPAEIGNLPALKILDISKNKVKIVPAEIIDCPKLKEINLKENPVSDRRLLKLIDQCRMKQVLDYIKQHCKRSAVEAGEGKTGGKKGGGGKKRSESEERQEMIEEAKYKIMVRRAGDDDRSVLVEDAVKKVRGYVLCCLLVGLEFTGDTVMKFIKMQTKLHEGVCEKRNIATIATHDNDKIVPGNLTYSAKEPKELKIKPLMRTEEMTGKELFSRLQQEAEALRKEKKRNVYTGIHKYLYLLQGQKMYPCLMDSGGQVISFPPITNSDVTKISSETKSILIEITSTISQFTCEKVMDALLKDTALLLERDLTVQQIRMVDPAGNSKGTYPAKNANLALDKDVAIVRVKN